MKFDSRYQEDNYYMKKALELAKLGIGAVNPNPLVGCIIVKDGKVIGEGYHMKFGGPHAEVNAINSSKEDIEGATVYVTLEPCAMCAAAIAHSRISNLYIGTFNIDMGACGTILNILDYNIFNHKINTIWCYDNRCSDILTSFFKNRRKNNKIERS